MITHHPDHVGSNTVSVTTTATSQTTSAIYLDPFGQKLGGSTPTRYVFTDQERDVDSGLDYFGARYYDAMIGRFISQDPELVSAHTGITFDRIQGDAQNHNAFSYVLNRPTRVVDPTGRYSDGWLRPPQLPPIIIDKREKIVLTPDGGFMSFAGGSTASATINQGGQTVTLSPSSLNGRTYADANSLATDAGPASRGDELLANPKDRNVVAGVVGAARSDVALRHHLSAINVTSGAVVKGQPGGNLTLGQVGTSIVSGLEEGSNCFAGCQQAIRGAQAIGVSLPLYTQESTIRARAGAFTGLSNQLGGVPVFVLAPKDGAIILFESGFEPRSVNLR